MEISKLDIPDAPQPQSETGGHKAMTKNQTKRQQVKKEQVAFALWQTFVLKFT